MSYIAEIERVTNPARSNLVNQEQPENPSAKELLNYAFCCAAQGLIWVTYLGVAVFVPVAISHSVL